MKLEGRTVWQQAAGDTNRNYVSFCLDWDVILNGPGYAGPIPEAADRLRADGWSSRKITDLKRFAVSMAPGDIVVLRLGTNEVHGVGEIIGPYEWHDEFGDIDGWDLQHVRRVRWLWRPEGKPMRFDAYAMNQGDTTQQLRNGPVLDWIRSLELVSNESSSVPLRVLPDQASRKIQLAEISSFLFDHGVASASITSLVHEIDELSRIGRWYKRSQKPSEHETVAYLVVPLLRALGWTPQRMAIEWNRVDLALFERLPRRDENLCAVVEAKKMDDSCLSAMSQALNYAQSRTNCHRLVVTDGLRYGVYTRPGKGVFRLFAYFNLLRLRGDYPVYQCKGAREALLALAPEWKPGAELAMIEPVERVV
ncbi:MULTISPECIES: hypothetical protein [Burkholderia]|uniref:Restriction endonuclease n=1 Tax=Burkholderia anthinoferrum TaxID=3090833 RepID=A0ABU5WP16_9BURK|nr:MULTISPECIES: hypothetical protein [Burkholderia]MEB2505597.1 hypothetical protein [Burkholderia anthinoferrum]MEB2529512.1 hypothetical protein [Burkholderia anthinoferrum]MEB2563979.1 hypothetical protein [Burkholderia anthinoferrum]MEB2580717.1 hypothetical protein [Burkholderia anthinoferrum]KVH13886.1 hypothetical protein WS84_09240 [Burkholderia anthina]